MCHDHGLPGRPRRTARPLKHTHEQGGETDRRGRGALQGFGLYSEVATKAPFPEHLHGSTSRPRVAKKVSAQYVRQTAARQTGGARLRQSKCEDSGAEDLHSEVATKSTYTHTSTLALTSNGEWLLCLQYIVSYPAPNQALRLWPL